MIRLAILDVYAHTPQKLLNEYSDHEVHLFEADERAGGHANTVRFEPPQASHSTDLSAVDVDTCVLLSFVFYSPI